MTVPAGWLHDPVQQRNALGLALLAATLAGISGVVAVDVFDHVAPITVAQFRSVAAGLVLGALAYRRRVTATGGRLAELGLIGAIIAAATLTYYWAIDRLGVGPGVTIQFLGPILALVWMRLVQRRRMAPAVWGAAVLAVAGTALATGVGGGVSVDPLGVAAALAAAVALAGYLIMGERLSQRLPGLTIGAYGFAVSAVVLLVSAPIHVPHVDWIGWVELGWIALGGTAAPFVLILAALRVADPGSVGVMATAEPVVATATAWVALGQSLAWTQILGGLAVITAVTLARSRVPAG